METATPAKPGILGSIRVLGESLVSGLQDRVALFSLELQEEKFRLVQTLFWISAAVFTAGMAIAFASLALVYAFWESARLAVLGGLALFYTAALVAIVIAFRAYLVRQPRPFAGTLQELETDRSCIRNGN
jgi:uncharacterized membrane protein YqjE